MKALGEKEFAKMTVIVEYSEKPNPRTERLIDEMIADAYMAYMRDKKAGEQQLPGGKE
ncbi:hypothetical protein X792_04865 [Dehalococcoides mccartyi CG1]|uniref:hypothetical protein n=1 Tax=Dehalococcoides mccartyi TaxID=61435 RepID=UPI0004E063CF|nr:hypothetical protein [Dehalococcoides mccartyi]AII58706.1 hypothetical protein X792_04865 [Dehalococcoides mccartyi CG1]